MSLITVVTPNDGDQHMFSIPTHNLVSECRGQNVTELVPFAEVRVYASDADACKMCVRWQDGYVRSVRINSKLNEVKPVKAGSITKSVIWGFKMSLITMTTDEDGNRCTEDGDRYVFAMPTPPLVSKCPAECTPPAELRVYDSGGDEGEVRVEWGRYGDWQSAIVKNTPNEIHTLRATPITKSVVWGVKTTPVVMTTDEDGNRLTEYGDEHVFAMPTPPLGSKWGGEYETTLVPFAEVRFYESDVNVGGVCAEWGKDGDIRSEMTKDKWNKIRERAEQLGIPVPNLSSRNATSVQVA